jgi:hypothetical protein
MRNEEQEAPHKKPHTTTNAPIHNEGARLLEPICLAEAGASHERGQQTGSALSGDDEGR